MLLTEIRARALASLIPPPRLRLSEWIERKIALPEGVSALPGKVRLWPYQIGIAGAISNPEIEHVVLVKPVRVGCTTLLTGAIGNLIANEPAHRDNGGFSGLPQGRVPTAGAAATAHRPPR